MYSHKVVDLACNGQALLEDVNDVVEYWHTHESELSFPAFLGMTDEEYGRWLQSEAALVEIINSRKRSRPAVAVI